MFKTKFVLATLLLAAMAIGVSSFTVKDYKSRAFATKCFLLEGDPTSPNSWTETNISATCTGGDDLCGICVDEDFLVEGGLSPRMLVDYATAIQNADHEDFVPISAYTDPVEAPYSIQVFKFDKP